MEMDMFLNHFADLFDETDASIITENTNLKDDNHGYYSNGG